MVSETVYRDYYMMNADDLTSGPCLLLRVTHNTEKKWSISVTPYKWVTICNSIEQNHWEANTSSASEEIARTLWISNIHYLEHRHLIFIQKEMCYGLYCVTFKTVFERNWNSCKSYSGFGITVVIFKGRFWQFVIYNIFEIFIFHYV
jgi:hypothetical protein